MCTKYVYRYIYHIIHLCIDKCMRICLTCNNCEPYTNCYNPFAQTAMVKGTVDWWILYTARGGHLAVWYPVLTTSTAAGVLRPQYLNPPFLKNRYQIFIFEDSKPSTNSPQKKRCLKMSMAFPCNLHHFWPCGPDIQGLPKFCAPPHCPPAAAANWRAARWRWASEDTAKSSRPCLSSRIFWVAAWLFHKYWD